MTQASRGQAQRIPDFEARANNLECRFCGFTSGLERGVTVHGESIVRCRDVLACDRRLRLRAGLDA